MRVFELPIALWPGRSLALGVFVERQSQLGVGANIYLGNGQIPNADIVGCVLTLEGSSDDSLAIFVNGLPLKDDEELAGSDPLEFDLFALATTAGLTLNTGDLVELFTKDNVSGRWSMFPWSVELEFSDGEIRTITGGEFVDSNSDSVPKYRQMGSFTLGAAESSQATSYARLGSINFHAITGTLQNDYADSKPVIDTNGFYVELTGTDHTLDEYDEFDAHSNTLLVLINEELFSVAGVELIAERHYRISVFRARLGTWKQSHSAGDSVYLFALDELFILEHPIVQPGNSIALKAAPAGGGLNGDPAEVDEVGFTITGATIVPRVYNLAIDGEVSALVRATGTDFDVTWSLPDLLDMPRGWTYQTRIQIVVDDIVVDEILSDAETVEILATDIDPLLTSGDFVLRACLEATSGSQTFKSEFTELSVQAI